MGMKRLGEDEFWSSRCRQLGGRCGCVWGAVLDEELAKSNPSERLIC